MHTVQTKTPLFIKPSTRRVLFSKDNISFRALNLRKDLKTIHSWVNAEYASEFWQLSGHFSMLWSLYQCMDLNQYSASFVGHLTPNPSPLGEGNLICQFDVYSVCADELKDHVDWEEHDCGFHLLMAPLPAEGTKEGSEARIPGLTVKIIKTFLEYYFSFSQAKRMYAEPDMRNVKSIALLEKCGFKKLKTVNMSYKEAHVYCLERQGSSGAALPRNDNHVIK